MHFSYAVGERNVHQIWVTCSWKASRISDHSNVTLTIDSGCELSTKSSNQAKVQLFGIKTVQMTKQSLCFNITNIVDFMFFVPLNSDGHMETGPWFNFKYHLKDWRSPESMHDQICDPLFTIQGNQCMTKSVTHCLQYKGINA